MANSAYANVSTLTTDLNISPYYDDYDKAKQYYRILYKPGFAVQARELTQMQTILQKQIDRFGKHVFKEGSIVLPGKFTFERDLPYIKIRDQDNTNTTVTVANYLNQTITSNSGITAYVTNVVDGTEASGNTKTLYVRYLSSNATANLVTFQPDEVITCNAGTVVVSNTAANTGLASRFIIEEGVFFAKEHFIYFPTQSVILDRYGTNPTCQVGFNVGEEIINYTQDISLLDPALEATNYAAPGADRLKLIPTLTRLDINEEAGAPDYVQLFVVREGVIEIMYEKSQYSVINDYFASRTEDESGDYYVNGLGVRIREHLNNNVNSGLYTSAANGNNSLLAVGVEPGRGYVKGYQVGNLTMRWVTTEKATTAQNINSQIITTRFGNYFIANEYSGVATHNTGDTVLLYDTARQSLTDRLFSIGGGAGSVIGTAKIKSVEYDDNVLGDPDGRVAVYLFDVSMNGTNNFSQTKSFQVLNTTGSDSFGDLILNSEGVSTLSETSQSLIYPVGASFVKTIRSSDLTTVDTTFQYKKTDSITATTGGVLTITLSSGGTETFPYSPGTLSTTEKNDIMVSFDTSFDESLTGTVSGTIGTNIISGSGTTFTNLNVGDKVSFSTISGQVYYITSITSNILMTIDRDLPSTLSGDTFSKSYRTGDLVDLSLKGFDSGTVRSVSIDATQKIMTINLQETYSSGRAAVISYRIAKATAQEMGKLLRPNRYTTINCSSAGTTGPFYLGVPDVYKIRDVRLGASAFTAATDGTSVVNQFTFDNGQRDEFYDHASITPKSSITLTSADHLLIIFDYFETDTTQGSGYFSVDSYPINDTVTSNTTITTAEIPLYKSTSTGAVYNLRDNLDFRTVKEIVSGAGVAAVASCVANPSRNVGFLTAAARVPAPQSQVVFDYSFYLPRKDVVALDKDNNIKIVKGEPAVVPITPSIDKEAPNSMALATLYIAPYPSVAPQYAAYLKRKDLGCSVTRTAPIRFTMKDIGVLKSRIENLEYYASLNALEKAAINLKILDENGLDRFKNGFFIDSFADHTLGATYNPDYQIVVDPKEKSIRPLYDMESVEYDYLSGSGVTYHANTGLITLPYTNEVFSTQNTVSTVRNIEASVYRFIGNMYLTPSTDMWVDTTYDPDSSITLGSNNYSSGALGTTWNSWQTKVTGYRLVEASTGAVIATFANKVDAEQNALALSRNVTFNQNTIGLRWQGGSRAAVGSGATPTAKVSTIIEEVSESTRTGSETYGYDTTDQISLGDRVIDVNLVPYIRPRIINIEVLGLKANTRYYSFFDGEDMNIYSRPLVNTGISTTDSAVTSSAWVVFNNFYYSQGSNTDPLISSSEGNLYYRLQIPSGEGVPRFRVGTKEVVITDNPTNDVAATSVAKSYYVAQGLVQTKQNTILTTRNIITYTRDLSETVTQTVAQFTQPLGGSCMAYSFLAKAPEGEEGIFMTGADVYIKGVHPTLGVWFELREMDAGGSITRTQVPFSEVWYKSSEIQSYLSDDASKAFRVTFPAPVFLYNNTQYAFVIHTEGLNPDTYFWVSRLGDTDIITGNKITSRPLTGTLYTTNNNLNWDIVPDLDLKVQFYRAKFTVGTGTATISNKPMDVFELSGVSIPFNDVGEIVNRTRLTLSGNTANISIGDTLTGQNSGGVITVLAVDGSEYLVTSNIRITTERADITGSSTGNTTVIGAVARANGTLSKFISTDTNTVIRLVPSDGTFKANDILIGEQSGARANVSYVANLKYSVVDFEPAYLNFNKTATQFKMSTTAGSGLFTILDNENFYLNTEQSLKSHTFESGSNRVEATLSTSTNYLSPVVDLGRTHSILVHNIINSNTVGETQSSGGELTNKYISKIVTLAEGQDAEDARIIITSYRPPTTNVHVYMKVSNGEDFESINSRDWFELNYIDDTVYSAVGNRDDFREYSFTIPESMKNANTGIVTYTNSVGTTFSSFKQFQIKIGLSSDNTAVVPKVADLRVIALQL